MNIHHGLCTVDIFSAHYFPIHIFTRCVTFSVVSLTERDFAFGVNVHGPP